MRESNHPSERLVKVLLPARLVGAMDDLIAVSGAYTDRSEFVADAVDGHLAELHARGTRRGGSTSQVSETQLSEGVRESEERRGPVIAAIPPLPEDTPSLDHMQTPRREPTWGMHNRDFPTLWALTHLSKATHEAGTPVPFSEWLPRVVTDAWDLGHRLPTDRFDVSGFPTNPAKREASEGRFVKFFIGDGPGTGPVFELGLAGADGEGNVAPTHAGLGLLRELEGLTCERGRGMPREWTVAYLHHLARYAPADYALMSEILNHIRDGHDDRTSLVQATADLHSDWSGSVVDTNVAGFVARAREWGLLLPRQREGRYVLEDEAISALEEGTDL